MELRDPQAVEEAPNAAQEGEEERIKRQIEENENRRREEEPVTGCAEESTRSQPVSSRLPENLVPESSRRNHRLYLRLRDASASHDGARRVTRRRLAGRKFRQRVELTRGRWLQQPRLYCARCLLIFFCFLFF